MAEFLEDFSPVDLEHPNEDHLLYVGEVATLLHLRDGVSYRQMQRMWVLSRHCQGQLPWPAAADRWTWTTLTAAVQAGAVPTHTDAVGHRATWTTYNAADILNIKRCIDIFGASAFIKGQGPPLGLLAAACRRLWERGISNPLVSVDIRFHPPSTFVVVEGSVAIEVLSDQTSMTEALDDCEELIARRVSESEREGIVSAARRSLPAQHALLRGTQLVLPI